MVLIVTVIIRNGGSITMVQTEMWYLERDAQTQTALRDLWEPPGVLTPECHKKFQQSSLKNSLQGQNTILVHLCK